MFRDLAADRLGRDVGVTLIFDPIVFVPMVGCESVFDPLAGASWLKPKSLFLVEFYWFPLVDFIRRSF